MTASSNISISSGWQSTHMVGRVAKDEPGPPTRPAWSTRPASSSIFWHRDRVLPTRWYRTLCPPSWGGCHHHKMALLGLPMDEKHPQGPCLRGRGSRATPMVGDWWPPGGHKLLEGKGNWYHGCFGS